MTVRAKSDVPDWARSLQRSGTPASSPVRGHHGGAVIERGSHTVMRRLPKGFSERIREQHVLMVSGLDEGLEHTDKVIEDWKKSL